MKIKPQSSRPAAFYDRRKILLAAPLVLAEGAGLVRPAEALAASSRREDECLERDRIVQANMSTFHHLDFCVFNHQLWDKLGLSHSQDVEVIWPDGRVTHGLDAHIQDLENLFAWAPDTQVFEHEVLFGGGDEGEFTGCVGVFGGTFTQPMPIGDGSTIPPTGNAYRITFATIAHWTPAGVFDKEWLLWDNQEIARQLGI